MSQQTLPECYIKLNKRIIDETNDNEKISDLFEWANDSGAAIVSEYNCTDNISLIEFNISQQKTECGYFFDEIKQRQFLTYLNNNLDEYLSNVLSVNIYINIDLMYDDFIRIELIENNKNFDWNYYGNKRYAEHNKDKLD